MGNSLSKVVQSSKILFNDHIKDGILKNIKEKYPEFISNFEFSGNLYENLVTEGQDDDAVVLVILKWKKNDITKEVYPGSAKFKTFPGSKYEKLADENMDVSPEKVRKWFFTLFLEEAVKYGRDVGLAMKISQPDKSRGVKIEIGLGENGPRCSASQSVEVMAKCSLIVNLIPAFKDVYEERFFVPLQPVHPFHGDSMKWGESYSMKMKAKLQKMDVDGGCRNDLFKVVNTILKREPTFSKLVVHLKMLFVTYINDAVKGWEKSKLDERFKACLNFLISKLEKMQLTHFWLKDVNLLSIISSTTLKNMETRLRRILNSEQERVKVLTY